MPKRLAIGGCLAISIIIGIVVMLHPNSLSVRYCPSGYYASWQPSLPEYRGGPTEQFNLVCIPNNQNIVGTNIPFPHEPRAPFDRIRQDPYAPLYAG